MMGSRFWGELADKIGVEVRKIGEPMVRVASAAVAEQVESVPDKVRVYEAHAAGFFRLARPMGWGLYRVEDIDGGLGSIWQVEKDAATGAQYLVKQVDPMGDVLRMRTASANHKKASDENDLQYIAKLIRDGYTSGVDPTWDLKADYNMLQDEVILERISDLVGQGYTSGIDPTWEIDIGRNRMRGASALTASTPPGKEKMVKELKKNPEIENPWAVAWSKYKKEEASRKVASGVKCKDCGSSDADPIDDLCSACHKKRANSFGEMMTEKKAEAVAVGLDIVDKPIEGVPVLPEPDNAPNPKGDIEQFQRIKRISTGETGTVLKVNDQKPGDIDVLGLWDQPHAGYSVFETDIGDVELLGEEPTPEQLDEAKSALEEHLMKKQRYEDDFKDKVKDGDSGERDEHAQDQKEVGGEKVTVGDEEIEHKAGADLSIEIGKLETDGGDVAIKPKLKEKKTEEGQDGR